MRLDRPLSARPAVLLATLLATVTFLFDLSQPLGVAVGIPYVGLPLLGLLARSPRMIVMSGGVATALILVGVPLSPDGSAWQFVALNRAMSIVLVWVVVAIAIRHLAIGDRLCESLTKQASEDPLTGLYNRRFVFDIVEHELNRYRRYRSRFSLILIDADHFKQVNDTWGHCAGDDVLRRIAAVCRSAVRECDIVGRFGGEEFIIVLPRTRAFDAAFVAHRIRRSMDAQRVPTDGGEIAVTLSLGIAECGPDADSFDALLRAADRALYAAKRGGRNRCAMARPVAADTAASEPKAA